MNKKNAGFTLIGVIVAMFILTVGLASILSLAAASLKGAAVSENRLIASTLAQEGIEMIREMRKSYPEWQDWYDVVVDGDYRVQYDVPYLLGFSERPLRLRTNSNYGKYQYDSGSNSIFYRKVTLDKVSAAEVDVTVEMKWDSKGQTHYLIAKDTLWNWK
jgi:type II secretory pathway pseudopilin PulG